VSIGRIDDAGHYSTFGGGQCVIQDKKGEILGKIPKSGGMYRVPHISPMAAVAVGIKQLTLRELHNRMGHTSPSVLKEMIRQGIIDGVVLVDTSDFECQACIIAKSTRKEVPKVREGKRATVFGEEIHSDLWGPARKATFGGRKYYVSFTDDWSRWTSVYLLKSKAETFESYKLYEAWVATQIGRAIKCLHSDRGGEYLSDEFIEHLDRKGTERKLAVHDTPQENGVAERLNRTLIERVRAMITASGLPQGLWGEALMHAVWLKNRTWTRALPRGETPFERLNQEVADLSNVPEWGCTVWVHDTSAGKLGHRAIQGQWVGYDTHSNAHRVYWKTKHLVGVERNVVFTKEELPTVVDLFEVDEIRGSGDESDSGEDFNHCEDGVEEVIADETEKVKIATGTTETRADESGRKEKTAEANPTLPEIRRSLRPRKPSQYVRDLQSGEFTTGDKKKLPVGLSIPEVSEEVTGLAMAAKMSEENGLEPRSLQEAMKSPDWLRWKDAIDEERVALEAHNTWKIVEPPKGVNVVGCRWVFRLKKDSAGNIVRYKARLVAQGFSQVPGIDFFDTYAPVAKMASIRTILALAARYDHEIHQVDVKNAYLNGTFEENEVIYMKQPRGLKLTENPKHVLQLLKPLYGLRQSARHWYKRLWDALRTRLRMKRCEVDQAVFYMRNGEELIVVVVHVDDLTIVTSTVELMSRVKEELKKEFKISDLGEIHWILGFDVKRNREMKTISLSQKAYIKSILEKYGFEGIKPYAAPMDPNCKLSTTDSPKTATEFAVMRDKPYRECVGSLQYAASGTRVDIAYVVNVLSRYLENPGPAHWTAVKHVFGYLAGTADLELMYGKNVDELTGFCDADGSMHEDRKAISGYAFVIDGGAVSWSSKKQEIIALSTTEAEYVAMTHAAKEALWMKTLISQVFGIDEKGMTLHSDNQSAIALTKDHQYHARTKHIDIRFHFIRWIVDDGRIKLTYCPTNDMLADVLTKALPSAKVKHFASALGLRRD